MILAHGNDLKISGVVDANPADLFAAPPENGWMVAHCKPRQDKLLCSELTWRGVPRGIFYERRVRRYLGKGAQEFLVPLLGGYVFCVGDFATRELIYRTDRVVRIIPVPRPARRCSARSRSTAKCACRFSRALRPALAA